MKATLTAIVFALLMGLSPLAQSGGDGPFPIYASVGTWTTPGKNYKVQISVWKVVSNDKTVMRVILRDPNGDFLASGFTLQHANDSSMKVVLTSTSGQKMQLTMMAEYKIDIQTNKKYLQLQFKMIDLDSLRGDVVPTSSKS
jgi:hypothetical protein